MDSQVGLFTSYMSPPAFMQLEQSSRMAALDSFNTIANFGNRDDISDSRRQLLEELNDIMARCCPSHNCFFTPNMFLLCMREINM